MPVSIEELNELQSNYMKYRGKCRELSEEAVKIDPSLRLVRGYYFCPLWGVEEQHWWCERPDQTIYDPSALQFPSQGRGAYREFDGTLECSECGKTITEETAHFDSRYAFCSYECHGKFIGVL
jgi:hypothetical protein